MRTINLPNADSGELDALSKFAESELSPELRDVVLSLSKCLREGNALLVSNDDVIFTPNQVAERLGMSRTHLYKLLDRGEIPFDRVGRDRRIRLADVIEFETQRQRDRRELAERFADQNRTRTDAINELADLL